MVGALAAYAWNEIKEISAAKQLKGGALFYTEETVAGAMFLQYTEISLRSGLFAKEQGGEWVTPAPTSVRVNSGRGPFDRRWIPAFAGMPFEANLLTIETPVPISIAV